ncbi:MAG: hypothetical protein IJ620_03595 [Bacteroidales bacterium]|nr:hypothetical protein [Bacteroidales bacterium]
MTTDKEESTKRIAASKTADSYDDEEDYIATPEEVAAEARRSAEKRAKKREQKSEDEAGREFGEFIPADSLIDPYAEPDPNIPWQTFHETPFLSRGCRHCPQAYQPVSGQETCSCSKVTSTNWLSGIRQPCDEAFNIVEVRFKNNRKDFFRLPDGIDVSEGDVVAVEGMPGHDIGIVTLTGEVCRLQMKKRKVSADSPDIKKLFRRAKPNDIEKWAEAIAEEPNALTRTRKIAEEMGLVMKVDDVEFQGDHSKAIFYYTADDRVDFRNLIKVLADEFHVRIEMKQIGVRQEAGRIGGLGTCGRELCCCTWLTNFKSVTTSSAKVQQIHPNPQKLAGQCGKLKCCLNFEAEVYADALKKFPPAGQAIRFQKGLALYKKTDVLRGIMWYAYEGDNELYAIKAENVKKVIEMNRNQQYPERLEDFQEQLMSTSALEQESSNAEFETELRRLADTVGERAERRDVKPHTDSRDNGPQRDRRQPRDRKARDGQEPKKQHDDKPRTPKEQQPQAQQNNRTRRDKGSEKVSDNRRENRQNRPPRRDPQNSKANNKDTQ